MGFVGWRDRMRRQVARLPVQHGDPDADTLILAECAPLAAARARATRHLLGEPDRNYPLTPAHAKPC